MITRRGSGGGTEPGFDGAAVFVLETCWAFIFLWWVLQPKVQDDLRRSPAVSGALGKTG